MRFLCWPGHLCLAQNFLNCPVIGPSFSPLPLTSTPFDKFQLHTIGNSAESKFYWSFETDPVEVGRKKTIKNRKEKVS